MRCNMYAANIPPHRKPENTHNLKYVEIFNSYRAVKRFLLGYKNIPVSAVL